jgi:hypothetical protein
MECNGMSRSKDERIKMKMGRSPRPEWWRPKRMPVRVKQGLKWGYTLAESKSILLDFRARAGSNSGYLFFLL